MIVISSSTAASDADTTNTQSSDTDTTQSQGDGTGAGADTPRTYTQAELDQIITDKLRGQGKEIERLKGFETEASKREAEAEDRRKAEMSETERAKAEADEARAMAATAQAERDKATADARLVSAKADIKLIVAEYGPVDGDVHSMVPAAALEVDDAGNRTDAAKKALDEWLTAKTGTLLRGKTGATAPAAGSGRRADAKDEKTGFNADLIRWRNQG